MGCTTVIAAQPTTTTYVQPTQRRTNEAIPTIGLVFSLIHLIGCLAFGYLPIVFCVAPALICAIVGLSTTDNEKSAKTWGWLSIATNIATIVFHVVLFFIVIIVLLA